MLQNSKVHRSHYGQAKPSGKRRNGRAKLSGRHRYGHEGLRRRKTKIFYHAPKNNWLDIDHDLTTRSTVSMYGSNLVVVVIFGTSPAPPGRARITSS